MFGCLRLKLPAAPPASSARGLAFGHCGEQAGCAGPGDTLYSDSEASGPKQRRGPQRERLVPIPVLSSEFPCESGKGPCSAGRRDGQRRQVAEGNRFQTSKRKSFLTVLGPERGRRLGRGGGPHRQGSAGKGINPGDARGRLPGGAAAQTAASWRPPAGECGATPGPRAPLARSGSKSARVHHGACGRRPESSHSLPEPPNSPRPPEALKVRGVGSPFSAMSRAAGPSSGAGELGPREEGERTQKPGIPGWPGAWSLPSPTCG